MNAKAKKILIFLGTLFVILLVTNVLFRFVLPIRPVKIVSSSMDHQPSDFDSWWDQKEDSYLERGVSKSDFTTFPIPDGVNKGDILIVGPPKNLKIGDVVLYLDGFPYATTPRLIEQNEDYTYLGLHDNNPAPLIQQGHDETKIQVQNITDKVYFRIWSPLWYAILYGIQIFLAWWITTIAMRKLEK